MPTLPTLLSEKVHPHHAPLHPVIAVVPFSKWGIDFMHCKPTSAEGQGYIIVAVDYFTKWAEEIPTYVEDGKTVTSPTFYQREDTTMLLSIWEI